MALEPRRFTAGGYTTSTRELSAARSIDRAVLRDHKTGAGIIDAIKKIGGVLIGGGGAQPPSGPTSFPPPGGGGFQPPRFTSPPPSGGSSGGACDRLPSILQAACRRLAVGGTGQPPSGGGFAPTTTNPCPSPLVRNPITGNCIDPTALPPGGRPAFVQAGGQAVQGAFGMPAISPAQQQRTRLSCPTGMVLGKDNLCYPKSVLGRRNRFRKWRPSPRPKISAAEWKTLKRADRVRDEAKEVAKTAGFKVTKR